MFAKKDSVSLKIDFIIDSWIMENRTWIVFANSNNCRHADAIRSLGFICWTMNQKAKFAIGDTVYLFMKENRRIQFKMTVVDENCPRLDKAYWIKKAPQDKTYRLELEQEYKGKWLHEEILKKYGFLGGRSIQSPCCNNTELNRYIDSIFEEDQKMSCIQNVYN